jgi:GNAT superfamily N-acetyltransferase
MEINIRPAKPEELEQIITLQNLSILNLHSNYRKYDRQQIDALVRGQAFARRRCVLLETILVAEDCRDSSLVGFAAIGDYTPKIHGVYVHPDLIGRGIGSTLLAAIEKFSIEKNVKTLLVQSSIESVDFYKKNGYTIQIKAGFLTGLIWIPCKLLKKELIPSNLSEKIRILLAIMISSEIAPVVSPILLLIMLWQYICK